MQVIETPIPDVLIIEPMLFRRHPPFFHRLYQRSATAAHVARHILCARTIFRYLTKHAARLHFQNPKVAEQLVTVCAGVIPTSQST